MADGIVRLVDAVLVVKLYANGVKVANSNDPKLWLHVLGRMLAEVRAEVEDE